MNVNPISDSKHMNFAIHGVLSGGFGPPWFAGKVSHRIIDLYNFLVFSSLLLCFECVAMTYVSCLIQEVPWSTTIAVIPFFAAFSIYNLNRKTDEDEDSINRKDRYAFTKHYERPLYYGAILAMVLCLAISASGGILSLLATSTPFILGVLYSFRLLPDRYTYHRLKEIPGVKNIIVGLAWCTPIAFLPVFLNHSRPDSATAVAFILFFLWGIMASLIPDIRDREGDASAGVRTIPVIYGEEKTKRTITFVLLVIGIPVIIFSFLFLPLFTTVLLLAANAYSHCCVFLSGREAVRDFVADVLSDGQYIFFMVAIFLGEMVVHLV
jgi:4-hydroxybenzoate polyprenyltransferase